MLVHRDNSLKYYTFQKLSCYPSLIHAVITRHGGYSEAPWHSMNLGGSVGDNPDIVRRNRIKVFDQIFPQRLGYADAWQVHGTDVYFASDPHSAGTTQPKADIIISDRDNLVLVMRFADCVPILLYDPKKNVIGLVHAGWRGTVKQAPRAAVEAMSGKFGSDPKDIIACIGPSIGPDHYEVGPEVVEQAQSAFGVYADNVIQNRDNRWHFDLWTATELTLLNSGVEQIEHAHICTACRTDDFFSHRAEKGSTGRFGVLIGLQRNE